MRRIGAHDRGPIRELHGASHGRPRGTRRSAWILVAAAILATRGAHAALGDVDLGAFVTDGPVEAIAHSADGSTFIGGAFTNVGPRVGSGMIVSASGNGAPDTSAFAEVAAGSVRAVVPDGSGGWFIGGDFTYVGTEWHRCLAHIKADGSVDGAWTPGVTGGQFRVLALALSANGSTLYVGGNFAAINGSTRNNAGAIDAHTGQVTAFDPNANGEVEALAVSGATVFAGGGFTRVGATSQTRVGIAAFDATTGGATTWTANADNNVFALAVAGTTLYAGGGFTTIAGQPRNRLAALDIATAQVSATWNPNASSAVYAVAVAGSTVYAGGMFTTIGGQPRAALAALSAGGNGQATSWNPQLAGNPASVTAIAVSPDGSIVYAGGVFDTAATEPRSHVVAVNASTGVPAAWDPSTDDGLASTVSAIALQGGKVYVGGNFVTAGPSRRRRFFIAHLASDGTLDESWDPGADGEVESLFLSGSTLFVGGAFATLGGQPRAFVGALDASSGTVNAWNPAPNGDVSGIAKTSGRLFIAGGFIAVGEVGREHVAALDPTTGDLLDWNPSPDGVVVSIAASGGTVYVGGGFSEIGGQPRVHLAALDAVTGAATAWDPGSNFFGPTALLVSGGLVYTGGFFFSMGHRIRHNIASLDPTDPDSNATNWDPEAISSIDAIAAAGGVLYLGGAFAGPDSIGGADRNYLAAFDVQTGLATAWDPSASGDVDALAATAGTVYAGGEFGAVGGHATAHYAQIDTGAAPTPTPTASPSPHATPTPTPTSQPTPTAHSTPTPSPGGGPTPSSSPSATPSPTPTPGPPDTTISHHPDKRTTLHRAVFRFTSDQPGSIFQCKLDAGPFAPCSSPRRLKKLAPGKHTFRVFAINPEGVPDPTPAHHRWTVKPPPPAP